MAPNSQELYVCDLLNLPLEEAKDKLWADGWLVATRPETQGASQTYQDKAGNSFAGKDRAGWLLADLVVKNDRLEGITFYDTNTTTGDPVPMPPNRILVR
ncbi:MAG: hypothetical protein ABSH01_01895 [Terriglobia bacterium]|jgi:hypothetical protein